MTLRTRIAAAAGIAVAITALALAAGDYAGTRSTLRGQIDKALASRAQQVTDQNGQRPGPPGEDHDGGGGGPFIGPRSTPFGDASGFVQLIAPDGTVRRGDPNETGTLPRDARALVHRQERHGALLTRMPTSTACTCACSRSASARMARSRSRAR